MIQARYISTCQHSDGQGGFEMDLGIEFVIGLLLAMHFYGADILGMYSWPWALDAL